MSTGVKISDLLANNPAEALTGPEAFEVLQNGESRAVTADQILAFFDPPWPVGGQEDEDALTRTIGIGDNAKTIAFTADDPVEITVADVDENMICTVVPVGNGQLHFSAGSGAQLDCGLDDAGNSIFHRYSAYRLGPITLHRYGEDSGTSLWAIYGATSPI